MIDAILDDETTLMSVFGREKTYSKVQWKKNNENQNLSSLGLCAMLEYDFLLALSYSLHDN